MGRYDQIINMKRPVDIRHPAMSLHNRAAQFAPFDALTGFSGQIRETSRLTEERIELTEEMQRVINETLQQIQVNICKHPRVTVTYFEPDDIKSGGSYPSITASVLKIDAYHKCLLMEGSHVITFNNIVEIEFSNDPDFTVSQ